MSEERFARIEATQEQLVVGQTRLEAGQAELRAGQDELRAAVEGVRTGQDELRAGLADVRSDVAGVRSGLAEVRSDVSELRVEVKDFGRQMRILHEEVLERLKAIPDPTESLRREMKAGNDALREELLRRIEPLELTARDHTAELSRLKARRR